MTTTPPPIHIFPSAGPIEESLAAARSTFGGPRDIVIHRNCNEIDPWEHERHAECPCRPDVTL